MSKIDKKVISHAKEIKSEVFKQILSLATSSFGLIAALAWNELIKEVVTQYVKPLIGGTSGIVSLGIYALIVTILAVVVTVNLSKLNKEN